MLCSFGRTAVFGFPKDPWISSLRVLDTSVMLAMAAISETGP